MAAEAGAPEREQGFLLIADMEGSTESKFRLGEAGAFAALREHNSRVIDTCRKAEPVPGAILNSLGDAVVAKFPAGTDEASRRRALESCLVAARSIVAAFEAAPRLRAEDGTELPLRTKLTLQFYDAYLYGRREELAGLAHELVGPHIDAAFRVEPLSWRLQVLVTERFITELLGHCGRAADEAEREAEALVRAAHAARDAAAEEPAPPTGIDVSLALDGDSSRIECWVTDAREIARLKGIPDNQRVFLLGFEPPLALVARGERARLQIKVKQDHHALVLASVALETGRNDDYIDFVLDMLGNSSESSRLESEVTLLAAAKIYGEFDFFFRVACIDDESLRRLFETIHDDRFGVERVEVRSTIADRFYVTPHYRRVRERFLGRRHDLVLTWFRREPDTDLFQRFVYYMDEGPGEGRPVEIVEAGEVIHHKPVYALLLCEDLDAYGEFMRSQGLNPTACRTHIAQMSGPRDARLRYGLMSGVWVPGRHRVRRRAE